MSRLTRDGTAEPVSRDQTLRHARGQGNIFSPVQLITSRIGNLTRLIHTLLYVMTIHTCNVNNSTIKPYKNRGLGKQLNVGARTLAYCTISFIVMKGCRTDTEYTRSLGYNSVCYITSRIGWVSLKGFLVINVDVILGNSLNTFCSTSTYFNEISILVVYIVQFNTVQCHRNNGMKTRLELYRSLELFVQKILYTVYCILCTVYCIVTTPIIELVCYCFGVPTW